MEENFLMIKNDDTVCNEQSNAFFEENSSKKQRIADIFIMQLIMLAAILIIFFVLNIIKKNIAEELYNSFNYYSGKLPEELIEKAVRAVLRFLEK